MIYDVEPDRRAHARPRACMHTYTCLFTARTRLKMYVPAKETFHKALRQLKLPRSSTVVVGLSGGSDSVALTYLARQAFKRVIAVTVDHRLRGGSGEEAEKAGEIARALGAEHHIVALDWEKAGGSNRTASRARAMRYSTLIQQCQKVNVDMLMVGHHANDQIETVLVRMMRGSGIVGLGGMHFTSRWAVYPDLSIVRPLLDCSKSSLIQLCREEGLEWVEDPSNQEPISPRNQIRPILAQHPGLNAGLADMMALCREAKDHTEPCIKEAMQRLACVNRKYGILSFNAASYQALNPYVARSVLAIWLRFIGSSGNSIRRHSLEKLHTIAMEEKTVADTASNCIIIPLPKERCFLIAKQDPGRRGRKVPIRVGETMLWDNQFKISLFADPAGQRKGKNKMTVSESELKSRVFYVRHFHDADHYHVVKGVRKVKGTVLVHHHVRGGLPVITDSEGNVVLIPHFRVKNYSVGIDCRVEFTPPWSMTELLQFHYISEDSAQAIDS